eukprot:TRINITY_DN56017_c0_g1_i1.p2 TRINITY_DN56017_c0_g1~~TRINITY_DN56017_c0_g1_i1.p2  ORF type:complete len:416 (+),score=48.48 TRINITY_DN56017_c0_g1_i1:41-1288(+)
MSSLFSILFFFALLQCSWELPTTSHFSILQAGPSPTTFNVRNFGAVGDGKTDDTAAFQKTFDALAKAPFGGVVYMPTGQWRLTATLHITTAVPMSLHGDGLSTVLLWEKDVTLLSWEGGVATEISVSSFKVLSVSTNKTIDSWALQFSKGIVRSTIDRLMMSGTGPITISSGIDMGVVSDTDEITRCVLWLMTGIGIKVGHGSEIRIEGGRIIGQKVVGSIGVHLTGNNGGVHFVDHDLIAWHHGLLIEDSAKVGSNREIFINQATIDSNYLGLTIRDNSYVTITGCWAASSYQANIRVEKGAAPLLVITGGTIFNAGAEGGDCDKGMCNGIVVYGGQLSLTGLAIRNNKGVGVWIKEDVVGLEINACKVYGNGQGLNITKIEEHFVIVGNSFYKNGKKNAWPSTGGVITGNYGL